MSEKNHGFLKGVLTGTGLSLVLILIVCLVSSGGLRMFTDREAALEAKNREEILNDAVDRLEEIDQFIDDNYLFEEDTDVQAMADNMLRSYVSSMGDPYSVYYTAEELADMMESLSGEYYGIGVMVSLDAEGAIHVVNVFSDSPALEAGILPGDQIVNVDGQDVAGIDLNQVVSYIKGAEGTTVDITVVREGEIEPITMAVERREVKVDTVYYEMMEDGIGYLQLIEFDDVSLEQVTKALEDMMGQGMKGLILDLRDNPGGLLTSVVDIADLFLPEANVLYMEEKSGGRIDYNAAEGVLYEGEVVILINGNTASAAEVLSGALKDHKIAYLVGETSFGKGIVQTYYNLSDGSGVKLTTAHYFTPGGTDIHGVGITPHEEVLPSEDSEKDVQLDRALELIREQIK